MDLTFNAREVQPDTGTPLPLPAGKYQVTISGAESRVAKSEEAGEMLSIEFTIDESKHPEFANRRCYDLLCINHQKAQTREIARRKLSAVCHAIDVLELSNTEQLLGHGLVVKLKVREAEGNFDARNDVASYHAIGGEPRGEVAETKKPAADAAAPSAAAEEKKPAATGKRKSDWKK